MNDQKLIKKIFSLAWYDFSNNFTRWLSIAGLFAVVLMIIYCSLSYLTSDYTVLAWDRFYNMVADFDNQIVSLLDASIKNIHSLQLSVINNLLLIVGSRITTILMVSVGLIIISRIVLQNALDLAFDSTMSGLSMAGCTLLYVRGALLSNIMLMGITYLTYFPIGLLYMMAFGVYDGSLRNMSFLSLIPLTIAVYLISLYLYWIQYHYLLSMHALEYKKVIMQSFRELPEMISGKKRFLYKILSLQIITAACIVTAIYFCLGTVIKIIMPMIAWFFDLFVLEMQPMLIQMIGNFFYMWAYILLYAWLCLVLAHVYRQLVCPPIDNIACPSCESCK